MLIKSFSPFVSKICNGRRGVMYFESCVSDSVGSFQQRWFLTSKEESNTFQNTSSDIERDKRSCSLCGNWT